MPAPIPPRLARLGIEREVADAMFPRRGGLVLVAGETGSGRTTIVEAAVATAHKGWRSWEEGGLDGGSVMLSEVPEHFPPAPHWPTLPRRMDVGIRIAMRDGLDVIGVDELHGPEAVRQSVDAVGHGRLLVAAVRADSIGDALRHMANDYAATFADRVPGCTGRPFLEAVHMVLLQRKSPSADGGQVWSREYVLLSGETRNNLTEAGASTWESVIRPHVVVPLP